MWSAHRWISHLPQGFPELVGTLGTRTPPCCVHDHFLATPSTLVAHLVSCASLLMWSASICRVVRMPAASSTSGPPVPAGGISLQYRHHTKCQVAAWQGSVCAGGQVRMSLQVPQCKDACLPASSIPICMHTQVCSKHVSTLGSVPACRKETHPALGHHRHGNNALTHSMSSANRRKAVLPRSFQTACPILEPHVQWNPRSETTRQTYNKHLPADGSCHFFRATDDATTCTSLTIPNSDAHLCIELRSKRL